MRQRNGRTHRGEQKIDWLDPANNGPDHPDFEEPSPTPQEEAEYDVWLRNLGAQYTFGGLVDVTDPRFQKWDAFRKQQSRDRRAWNEKHNAEVKRIKEEQLNRMVQCPRVPGRATSKKDVARWYWNHTPWDGTPKPSVDAIARRRLPDLERRLHRQLYVRRRSNPSQ